MRILRKLKKLADIFNNDDAVSPPNGRRQMRNDPTAPLNVDYGPLPPSFFNTVNLTRKEAGYDPLPIFPRRSNSPQDENLNIQDIAYEFPAFDQRQAKSVRRPSFRSAAHLHSRPPPDGTPVKFRRRPISPELLQSRSSSPFLFHQNHIPASPDMIRRFQQAQPVQYNVWQLQSPPNVMMVYPFHDITQTSQAFDPMINFNLNLQPWLIPSQQQQMKPFF